MSRRRRAQRLERVLGTPALFSTAYGNVGSSIYYALGVVAVYALGLTPVVFIIAGLIFACTAATYVEGTVHYPEAGGSSSFARHAFNELVSFEAAWAQMLNYIATIAVSAFFVPHYLSVFWSPLRQNPWDIVFGIVVIGVLVLLNIVGIQESARVNIFLAVADFATQLLLVILGFVLVFSPETLKANVHLGVAPTWSSFFLSIPVAMLAYTGIETVSNLSEEARDPLRTIPRSVLFVAIAVFAIYFTLPWVALSAMPVEHVAGEYKTLLALPPTETFHGQHGYQNDPVLGLVNNLGLNHSLTHVLQIYLGILASTILFIGANAGVIGASRITYAMAGYRQLPLAFRRIHPRFKTPWLALVFFAGAIPIGLTLSGQTSFLGSIYAFGATFSFTVAHAAIIRMRMQQSAGRGTESTYRSRPNLRLRGVDWPVFALLGVLGTGLSWLVIVVKNPSIRYTGIAWLVIGFVFYVVYRRRVVHAPLTETIRAPVVIGPGLALEYRNVLVPIVWQRESEAAVDLACRLAVERHGSIVALTVIEVPLELPLDAALGGEDERRANELLDEARAIGDAYGVNVIGRLVRARRAGRAIVDEAERRESEIIVMGAPRRNVHRPRGKIFGGTVDFVLKNAPCRVMVAAAPRAA
jgi:APA family basic amino acid/polyamine antiporter